MDGFFLKRIKEKGPDEAGPFSTGSALIFGSADQVFPDSADRSGRASGSAGQDVDRHRLAVVRPAFDRPAAVALDSSCSNAFSK